MLNISAILLGAGESRRMGKDKLSLPWKKKTIFEQCLQTLLGSRVNEVIVVLKDRVEEVVFRMNQKKVTVAVNRHYKKGMSASIRRGVRAMDPKSQGILIALGDQPTVKARTINALIRVFKKGEGEIIVPSFKGRRGNPVIFHRRYAKELLRLKGDVGGKSIVEKHPGKVCIVPVKSEGVVRDIDTWMDYRKELRMNKP
jgi:molybdenum cofactor cytidylyltransferase